VRRAARDDDVPARGPARTGLTQKTPNFVSSIGWTYSGSSALPTCAIAQDASSC
jgi:hypothetical protein